MTRWGCAVVDPAVQQAARQLSARPLREGFKPAALHEYEDENGTPLFWRVRLKHPDGRKWIRPMKRNDKGFVPGEPEFPNGKLLYLLPSIARNPNAPVWIVEGESCADALAKLGIVATTSGGADSAGKADWGPLKGRRAIIWPDNDAPGLEYAEAVLRALKAIGAASIELIDIRPLGLPEKGDVVDWLTANPGATAQDVAALARVTPAAQCAEDWPEPKPLPELPPVPPFPVNCMPGKLRAWISDMAERAQYPVDFAAVSSMVALGSLIGRKLGVRLKARDDWTEYANIWGCLVGTPSALKSPALREGTRHVKRFQVAADKRYEAALKEHQSQAEKIKLENEARKAAYKKALTKGEEAALELTGEPEAPVKRVYWTSDVTVEQLGVICAGNSNGVLIERDELGALLTNLDDDRNATLRGFYLSGWSAKESFCFDRVVRGRTLIPSFAVSILGGIQPGVLERHVRAAFSGERADGLLQRLQLIVWPDQSGFHYADRYPDNSAKDAALSVYEFADTFDPSLIGEVDQFGDGPPFVRLSPGAQPIFEQWYGDFMRERRRREGNREDHGALAAHLGKFPGLLGKLAVIIHVADDPTGRVVSERSLIKALTWLEYLEAHARRVYHAVDNPATDIARLILARIRSNAVSSPFAARDIYRNGWHGLGDTERVKAGLRLLADYDYLREVDNDVRERGRPAGPIYVVNPALQGGKS